MSRYPPCALHMADNDNCSQPLINVKRLSQIRREYAHVPTETFCRKRAEILHEFLAAGSIYATDQYRRDREAVARANIEAEIALLDKGDLTALEAIVDSVPSCEKSSEVTTFTP